MIISWPQLHTIFSTKVCLIKKLSYWVTLKCTLTCLLTPNETNILLYWNSICIPVGLVFMLSQSVVGCVVNASFSSSYSSLSICSSLSIFSSFSSYLSKFSPLFSWISSFCSNFSFVSLIKSEKGITLLE